VDEAAARRFTPEVDGWNLGRSGWHAARHVPICGVLQPARCFVRTPGEGGPGLRVTFKDYGFFVPTDSAGATARVQGTLKVAQLTAAQADHLRAEGGSMAAGAQREVRLIASGVELRR